MIRNIRLERGLTAQELSQLSGINKRMIEYYESGYKDINKANLKTLCSLAISLKCKISDLLTDPELLQLFASATRKK